MSSNKINSFVLPFEMKVRSVSLDRTSAARMFLVHLDFRFLHNYNDNMSQMYERIKQMLIKGIFVCDRKYEFVAFSSSQLREHSCWMFASLNSDIDANSIRTWMGDFRNIRPVAKYAARVSEISARMKDDWHTFYFQLGQSFSTSIKGIALKSSQFREISDVEKHDENSRKLCFTDGVGIIAPWLAERLVKKVKSAELQWCPAAFQIRCGGFKGKPGIGELLLRRWWPLRMNCVFFQEWSVWTWRMSSLREMLVFVFVNPWANSGQQIIPSMWCAWPRILR